MDFTQLGLDKKIIQTAQTLGFTTPTKVQELTIPHVLAGKDVIALSATGSGKTFAFGAGIIQKIHPQKKIQSLILVPTRELAEQITTNLKRFATQFAVKMTSVYGGVSINPQIEQLKHTHIVVGTPGRIKDHIERKTIDLSGVQIAVLDEADRMLDMGFLDDVSDILKCCPKSRQTLLFSATMASEIEFLTSRFMNNPVRVQAEQMVDPRKLKQVYYDIQPHQKLSLLIHLLKQETSSLTMVFCNSRSNVDFVTKNLKKNSIEAIAIHGGLTQNRRTGVLEAFHSQEVHVLVCTDVAARGLDIQGISHVYNYDTPMDSKQYVHRIGRTARAGSSGIALSLICNHDYEYFDRVLRDNDVKIEHLPTPEFPKADIDVSRARRDSGRQGGPRRFGNRNGAPSRGGYGGGRSERSNSSSGSRPPRPGQRPFRRPGAGPRSDRGQRS